MCVIIKAKNQSINLNFYPEPGLSIRETSGEHIYQNIYKWYTISNQFA